MEKVKLKKNSGNMYTKIESQCKTLESLAFFLKEDCWRNDVLETVEWLKEVNEDEAGIGELYSLIYRNGNVIISYIPDYLDDDELEKYLAAHSSNNFITTREYMLEILTEWDRILHLKPLPEEIVLTYDGNKVNFITSYNSKSWGNFLYETFKKCFCLSLICPFKRKNETRRKC